MTHDLGVISEMADRVVVMYGGRKCEEAMAEELFVHPVHPYTRGLISSRPDPESKQERLPVIPGSVPSLKAMPEGCPFHNRCPYATEACKEQFPAFEESGSQHLAACYNWRKASEHE